MARGSDVFVYAMHQRWCGAIATGAGQLPEDVVQRAGDFPVWIVGPQPPQVADVGNVIAETTRLHVIHRELPAGEVPTALDGLEDRDAVGSSSPEVVHGGRPRRLVELEKCRAHIVRVQVVADLLALVAVDTVDAPFLHGPDKVGEKTVELCRGVIGAGQAPTP